MDPPGLLIGLTVVAYGTSAPEVVVGVKASLDGAGGIALGNVVSINIANLGLILGLTTLFRPAQVDGALIRREIPVLTLCALAVPVVLIDGVVTRLEGRRWSWRRWATACGWCLPRGVR